MSTGMRKTDQVAPATRPRGSAGKTVTTRSGAARRQQRRGVSAGVKLAVVVAVALGILGTIFVLNNRAGQSSAVGQGGKYPYQVGRPGPGELAPPIKLPATDGSTFDLSAARGQTVLLYFQEGVGCQPCWDQLKEIEANWSQFQALGLDRIITITGDPLAALQQKAAIERLTTPLLSDAGLAVSRTYQANQYGMMGTSANGHSFILVGKDGAVVWRADYGGAPKYTMYVPVPDLLAALRDGLARPGR